MRSVVAPPCSGGRIASRQEINPYGCIHDVATEVTLAEDLPQRGSEKGLRTVRTPKLRPAVDPDCPGPSGNTIPTQALRTSSGASPGGTDDPNPLNPFRDDTLPPVPQPSTQRSRPDGEYDYEKAAVHVCPRPPNVLPFSGERRTDARSYHGREEPRAPARGVAAPPTIERAAQAFSRCNGLLDSLHV